MTDAPQLGDVWSFPFLWKRQERRGETEGRKYRLYAIVLLTKTERGQQEVLLVPITSQPSENNPLAVEVPEIEKKTCRAQYAFVALGHRARIQHRLSAHFVLF